MCPIFRREAAKRVDFGTIGVQFIRRKRAGVAVVGVEVEEVVVVGDMVVG